MATSLVPPPGAEVNTVTEAVPAWATRDALTAARNSEPDSNAVGSADPFQYTTDRGMKYEPVTVSRNAFEPTVAVVGVIDDRTGRGTDTMNGTTALVARLAEVNTVTDAVPIVATSAAGTSAVSFVADT